MSLKKFFWLGLLSFLLLLFGREFHAAASAYQVNYTIEKYGSNQTSIADAYFAKPATVLVGSNQYSVTMTVKTSHDLGSFPVQILNVNGQTPSVQKSTSGNTDYYTFTFTTQSVKQTMSGNMKVDINSLNYHHVYGFNLRLAADNVPQLTTATASQSQAAQSSSAISSLAASASSSSTQAKTASSASNSSASSSTVSASSQSSTDSSLAASSSVKKVSHKQDHQKSKQKQVKKSAKKADQQQKSTKNKKKNHQKVIVAFVVVVVLAGAGFGAWRMMHH